MKAFLGFVARWIIPALWLLAVARAIVGGFERGLEPIEVATKPLVYPWVGVLLVCLWTAVESVILYAILRPHNFSWSLPHVVAALGLFIILSYIHSFTTVTDSPGYLYVPAAFTFIVTALLSVLFLITVARTVIRRVLGLGPNREKAA